MIQLDKQYIDAALSALRRAYDVLQDGTPIERGVAAAACICAAIDIEVRVERQQAREAA
jgi:hypothetical protein